jgi:hypothetical protein
VADDVVESAERIVAGANIEGPQDDVLQAERGDDVLSLANLLVGQIDPDKSAVRQGESHRDQVASAGASQLEDAAAVGRRRAQAEQGCQSCQLVWVALGDWVTGIRDLVITGANRRGDHRHQGPPARHGYKGVEQARGEHLQVTASGGMPTSSWAC